ncbi:5-formyltetrahydrofolate cyclo-ligase [Demetria terragena]|uniref:5-formyltetrahydrofolate cyclo-ligase n=1 Tax=Demetria terragena TaxID=63959 RepID=UPI000375A4E5|nr:5-formyltetrahydrofolate cyclo-ligase [Demetria terragena]
MPERIHLPPDKSAARRLIRERRRHRAEATSLDARVRHAEDVRDHLAPVLDRLPTGAVVTSFVSRPSEVPTEVLNATVRSRGLDLILPVVLADLDLDWSRHEDGSEPLGIEAVRTASLLILPALAVAENGLRLGQGGGCYDRVMPRVPASVPRIALVHDDEFTATVPVENHDLPVDAVVTASVGLCTFATWPWPP